MTDEFWFCRKCWHIQHLIWYSSCKLLSLFSSRPSSQKWASITWSSWRIVDIEMTFQIVLEVEWHLVFWGEQESFMCVVHWSVEIFSLKWVSVMVVFTIHYLMIVLISTLNIKLNILESTFWTHWCSFFPEKFIMSIKFQKLIEAIAWCSVLIGKSICVLMVSTTFIKELSILCVIMRIIFAISYMRLWIPWWQNKFWWFFSFLESFATFWWEWASTSRIVVWIVLAV